MSYVGNNTFGILSSAQDGSIINYIYEYVISILQSFDGTSDENENAITNRLCKTLEYKKPATCPYFFHHQNLEDDRKNTSTDFAAFGTFAYAMENSISNDGPPPLIKFETKRLNSTIPKKREREYVIGEYENGMCIKNSGGIERFKNLRHGKNVIYAGIIGYVQTGSFEHWVKKINGWVKDEIISPHDSSLTWDPDDYLKIDWSNSTLCHYISILKRKNLMQLDMHHIWVKFN
jgi:hypothetical protein